MSFDPIYQAVCPAHVRDILNGEDKTRSGKIANGRCFNIHCYLDELSLNAVLTANQRKIRCYAYCYHDQDLDDDGKPLQKHVHLVIRTYSQFTRYQIYRWFQRFAWGFDKTGDPPDHDIKYDPRWCKIENISVQFTLNIDASIEYLTHSDDPDKYHYPRDQIVSNNINDLCSNVDCKDNSLEIIEALISGATPLEMVKRYGREYVYHYAQYKELAYQCRYYRDDTANEDINEWITLGIDD